MILSRLELNGQGLFTAVHELKLTEHDRFFNNVEHYKPKEEYHDFISILQDFDEEMPMPEINDYLENGKFFFTAKALEKFSSQIADLKHIFETLFPELDFKIINREVTHNDCRIVYRDPYQVFFDDTPSHYRSENKKEVEINMKNKSDFLNDVSWLIFHSDECFKKACPLYDRCHDDNVPCANMAKAHDELIKKYNLED